MFQRWNCALPGRNVLWAHSSSPYTYPPDNQQQVGDYSGWTQLLYCMPGIHCTDDTELVKRDQDTFGSASSGSEHPAGCTCWFSHWLLVEVLHVHMIAECASTGDLRLDILKPVLLWAVYRYVPDDCGLVATGLSNMVGLMRTLVHTLTCSS